MNQIEAFRETLSKAKLHWPTSADGVFGEEVSIEHMEDMLRRIEAAPDSFSAAKIGRWLGYFQGVACAFGVFTLSELKDINKRWAD